MKILRIKISAISFVFITAIMFLGCKKYDRDNPNDLLGENAGNAGVTFGDFKITDDVSGDGKIQKFETGKLWLSLKNTGQKISSQISKVEFTALGDVVVFSTEPVILNERIMVGKQEYNVKVDFWAPDVPNPTGKAEVTADVSFLDGTSAKVKFNIDIIPTKASRLVVQSVVLRGYNEFEQTYSTYRKGLIPVLTLSLRNSSNAAYKGKLSIGLIHVGTQYSFENHTDLPDVNLNSGQIGTYNVRIGCFPMQVPDNYSSPSQVNIYDEDSGFVQGGVVYRHNEYDGFISFGLDMETGPNPNFINLGEPFTCDLKITNNIEFPLSFYLDGFSIETNDGSVLNNVKIELIESNTPSGWDKSTLVYRMTGVLVAPPTNDVGYVKFDINLPISVGQTCPVIIKTQEWINYKK